MTARGAVPDSSLFDRAELVTGPATERQTILSGFFLGGATAELAVVCVDQTGARRLQLYGLEDGSWVPVLATTLRAGVLFVDVANLGGRDRLITFEPGRSSWFDPDTATERRLVDVSGRFGATDAGEIPRVDVTRDLNGDGRDDLVLPDVEGFWISIQESDGSFTEPVQLGPAEPYRDEIALDAKRPYGEVGITALTVPWYLSRVHQMDYDRDGRDDLVFWNRDHFEVHLQNERGRFSPRPETFSAEVPFDSDGVYSLAFGFGGRGALSLMFGRGEKTKRTVLQSIRDLNGDGVADLVTYSLEGRNLRQQRSSYAVHFGVATPDGQHFEPAAGAVVQPRGKAGGLAFAGYASQQFVDLDGDDQLDLMRQDVRTGLPKMVRTLVGHSVSIDLELYRAEDGVYPDEPTTRRKIRPAFRLFAKPGNIFFPPVLMGDINGDGRSDLLVGNSPRMLHVFLGVPEPQLLAHEPMKVTVALPRDERNAWLTDLNRDGKQDLIVHLASPRRATGDRQRLVTLIAR